MRKQLILLFTAFSLLSNISLSAQGWEHLWGPTTPTESPLGQFEHSSEGLFFLTQTGQDFRLYNLTQDGQILWQKSLQDQILPIGQEHELLLFEELDDSNILLAKYHSNTAPATSELLLYHLSTDGNIITEYSTPLSSLPQIAERTSDNRLLLVTQGTDDIDFTVTYLDINGNTLWSLDLDVFDNSVPEIAVYPYLRQTPDHRFLLVFENRILDEPGAIKYYWIDTLGNINHTLLNNQAFNVSWDDIWIAPSGDLIVDDVESNPIDTINGNTIWDFKPYLRKMDTLGNVEWQHLLSYANSPLPVTPTKGLFLTPSGDIVYARYSSQTIWYIQIDANGNIAPPIQYPNPFPATSTTEIESLYNEDGELFIACDLISDDQRDICYAKFDASGQLLWTGKTNLAGKEYLESLKPLSDGGYLVSARYLDISTSTFQTYVFKIGPDGTIADATISGTIYSDIVANCNQDPEDIPWNDIVVVAEGPLTYYGTTDSTGYYQIPVQSDTYTVQIPEPSPLWVPCENPVTDSFPSGINSLTIDFPVEPIDNCPYMVVDMATNRLRPCFENTYVVQYCNLGTAPADSVIVEVTLDSVLAVNGSSIPWTSQDGNTFTFHFGTVDLLECGTFELYCEMECDVELSGQTFCSEASIYPDTLCLPPISGYNGAFIEVAAECQDTTVNFYIQNTGNNTTSSSVGYIVIEDAVLMIQDEVTPIDPSDIRTIKVPANGSTYHFQADQEPGAPGNSIPIVGLEGCGINGEGDFSVGILNQFPLNDGNPFVDLDCQTAVNSFDPNDKTGFPLGYGPEHFITKDQELEYLIRFQNTGTDTAYKVVIRDTLTELLEIASIRPGPSSHPYEFEVYGNRILQFTFADIDLVDSTTNEPLSHGFVKFTISQRSNNPNGTVIENKAGIYFDFNPPIITNTTWHTIGENFITQTFSPGIPDAPELIVRPNPFSEETWLEWQGADFKTGTLNLYNPQGRLMRSQSFDQLPLHFQRGALPSGMYFVELILDNQKRASGRLILQ
jgi:uncharacterized repeat protein (TIGR01451 family)